MRFSEGHAVQPIWHAGGWLLGALEVLSRQLRAASMPSSAPSQATQQAPHRLPAVRSQHFCQGSHACGSAGIQHLQLRKARRTEAQECPCWAVWRPQLARCWGIYRRAQQADHQSRLLRAAIVIAGAAAGGRQVHWKAA